MSKALTLGNGNILVCLDKHAEVRDFYFPYVGLENHIGRTLRHRVGVWTEGVLHWFSDEQFTMSVGCDTHMLCSTVTALNTVLGVSISITDTVYNEKNIFLRNFEVTNLLPRSRDIKIFFAHEFELYESYTANTAYFDPFNHVLIHYRGRRAFLINAMSKNTSFDDYTTGVFGIENKEGSYRDAEDGILSKNPIEHGPADSVIGLTLSLNGEESRVVDYWIAVGESIAEVQELNAYCIEKGPAHLTKTTADYWKAWLGKRNWSFHTMSGPMISLFKKSQLILRAHADDHGAIIASSDSDMLNQGKDTYSYMWPRDGAYCAMAIDSMGDFSVSRRFFEFCNDVISEDGYFMHKYGPDRALGSSWHPWVIDGDIQLPIQEDETAIVLIALWKHYLFTNDLEFIEEIYNSLILKAGMFLATYRFSKTGLPKQSFDLWEEKLGVHTYTASTVYGALQACAHFAELLGKGESALLFKTSAEEVKKAILTHLYDEKTGIFYKMLRIEKNGSHVPDTTLDMSTAFGLFEYGILEVGDPRMTRFIDIIHAELELSTHSRGIIRYSGDRYYRSHDDVPGNPWIITTLWLAQYYIDKAVTEKDLEKARGYLEWTVSHAEASGILPEQLDPHTGGALSASPLTWSHATYISSVVRYLSKLEKLGVCLACNLVDIQL